MVQPSIAPTFETWAPSAVPTSKPTRVPSPKPSPKPTFKPTPQSAKSFPPTPRPVTPTLRPTPMPSKVPVPAPTAPPSAAPTSFPSLTPTASQAPTRKGSITWAHVGEDIEVRGLGMHKFTANADNSVMFFFAGYHDDCDDGARAAKMAADPPTNDAAWNNASYCLYPNGNGISAGRWPPDCWPTYDKKGKCSNQDREGDVAEDCNRKAWWRAKYGIGECLAPHFDVDLAFYQKKDDGTSALVRTENHISYTPYLNVSWHLDGQADGLYYFVATDSTCGVTSTSPDVFLTSSQAPTPRPSDQPTSVPTAAPSLAPSPVPSPVPTEPGLSVVMTDSNRPGGDAMKFGAGGGDPEKDDVLAFDGGDGVTVDMAVAFTGQDESAKVTVRLCKDGQASDSSRTTAIDDEDTCAGGTLVATLAASVTVTKDAASYPVTIPAEVGGAALDGTGYYLVMSVIYDRRKLSTGATSFATGTFGVVAFYPTPRPTRVPWPAPTAAPSNKPTLRPTPEPTEGPTPRPTPKPTMWPTAAPTAERLPFQIRTQGTAQNGDWTDRSLNFEEPARTKIQFIQGAGYISETGCARAYPGVDFAAATSSVATKDDFLGQCGQQAQYGPFVFDFEFDVLLVEAATDAVVQILCSGCQSDGENMWTGDWTPDRAKVDASLPTTLYRIKVVEYSYGLVGRSSPLTVQDGVFDPTPRPTPTPTPAPTPEASNPTAVPIPAPTMLPTTNTLSMELHGADGHLVPLWKSGDGGFLAAGEAVTGTLRFTGDEDQSRQVTIRLCRGEAVAGPDLCTDRDGKFVAEVEFMKQVDYDASAASNDGTPIDFFVPTGIQAGNNYFFVLFAYADARRKMLDNVSPAGTDPTETQTYVTGAFTVYDYAPTPAPSPSPSTAAPSNVGRGPTLNPTYEPKPVEDIPCTATVESGIPDDKVWEWGQDVELKIKMCHWYSYSYGVVDVLLYGDEPNKDPVDSLAQYQSVHDNTLTVKYTVPQCTDQDLVTGECTTDGLNFPDNEGVPTTGSSRDSFKLRIIEYGHGLDTGGWSSAGTWDRQDLEFKIRTKHIQAPTPEPTKAPSQDGTIDCFHTALFAGTDMTGSGVNVAAGQVEM